MIILVFDWLILYMIIVVFDWLILYMIILVFDWLILYIIILVFDWLILYMITLLMVHSCSARSVFERALDVDHRNITVWLKYSEMEMKWVHGNRIDLSVCCLEADLLQTGLRERWCRCMCLPVRMHTCMPLCVCVCMCVLCIHVYV